MREQRIRDKAKSIKDKEMANERWKSIKSKPLSMMLGRMKSSDNLNLAGSLNSKIKIEQHNALLEKKMNDIDSEMNKNLECENTPFEKLIDSTRVFQMACSSAPYEPQGIDAIQEEE